MKLELKIAYEDGQVTVTGPIDHMFAYAMLEIAKNAINQLHAAGQVIPVPPYKVPVWTWE